MRENVRHPTPGKERAGNACRASAANVDTVRIGPWHLALSTGRPALADGDALHVYFPTEEASGFPFTVHADFQVEPDRTELITGSYYNRWLFQQIAALAAGEFLSKLLARFDVADASGGTGPHRRSSYWFYE